MFGLIYFHLLKKKKNEIKNIEDILLTFTKYNNNNSPSHLTLLEGGFHVKFLENTL